MEAPRPRPRTALRPPSAEPAPERERSGGWHGGGGRDVPPAADPWDGDFAKVMASIESDRAKDALAIARAWHERSPGDVLALVALGEAHEALGDPTAAARAYGSLVDLHPSRVDIRWHVGGPCH